MNKTAILSFIIDEVALKCRNVSSNMRKRIHWMLKYMEITVKEYDVRALVLNGWIRVGKEGASISKLEEIKKGVSNYTLKTQEQLDKLMTLNNEIRCSFLDFTPTTPVEVESINNLSIRKYNYDIYSKCSLNKVNRLALRDLSFDQIKFILTKVKRIDRLEIARSTLESIDLSQSKIKEFNFIIVSFKGPVYLPKQIDELQLRIRCSLSFVKVERVNRVMLVNDNVDNNPQKYKELIESLKGTKFAAIESKLSEYFTSLPSTLREIHILGQWNEEVNLEKLVKYFPNLIDVNRIFPIEELDKTKLRIIQPRMSQTEKKFNLKPRKIIIDSNNATQLNNHSELFEKVEWVWIHNNQFNYDLLSSEIKRIEVDRRIDEESYTLNRLEKERE